MLLETQRLKLRKFCSNDTEEAFAYLSDPKTMYYVEDPFTLEQTQNFIEEHGLGDRVYAIIEKSTERLIGHMVFHKYDNPNIFEIGCILGSDYWGNGYAVEMAKALIEYGFFHLKLHKIVAHTVGTNIASVNFLRKLGFVEEGILRLQIFHKGQWVDEYCFGILHDEYD